MTVKYIGESYDFPCANQLENYGGLMTVYVLWEHHLIYCAPNAYPVSPDMKLRDFLEQMFTPSFRQHPDADKVDWNTGEWQLENEDWVPDLDKSFKENNIDHCSFLRVTTPDCKGMHGVGN